MPQKSVQYQEKVYYRRCKQCNECKLSGADYRKHMNPNNCAHGCKYYHSSTSYRYVTKTKELFRCFNFEFVEFFGKTLQKIVPAKNETCSINYGQIKSCQSCVDCKTKSKVSMANETEFINYAMASKSDREETSSESIKMLIGMNGDDVSLLKDGFSKTIASILLPST